MNNISKQYVALAILESLAAEFLKAEADAQAAMSSGADAPESDLLSIHESVGIIDVKGKLTNRDSLYNRWYGLISYNQIRAAAIEAMELGAEVLLFDYDTPGGAVAGMGDHSSFIEGIPVPTIAHTSGQMASAGYFSGASNDYLFADNMSEVGSIGVVMQHIEFTEAMKKQGIKADTIRSGSKKAIGGPYEKLSAKNRSYLQGQVDTYAGKFFDFVSETRGIPLPAMGQIKEGGTFIGEESLQAGLIDKIMSFDETLIFAMDLAQKELDNKRNNSDYYGNGHSFSSLKAEGDNIMPKKVSKAALAALVLAGKETPAAQANEEKTPEELAAEAAANTQTGETTTGAETSEGSEEGQETEEDLSADLLEMTEKYDASQVELAEASTKYEDLMASTTATVNKHVAEVSSFSKIIVAQINTMRTALSLSTVDMASWAADAILTEYNSVSESFEKSLPVGGVVPNQEGKEKETKTETRDDVNAIAALGF